MKLRIIKEVGLYNSFTPRGNVDVKITLVKPDGKTIQQYDDDVEELSEKKDMHKVTCHCLCRDCIFNRNDYCIAEKIDLDYAKTEDGRIICECKTYKIGE